MRNTDQKGYRVIPTNLLAIAMLFLCFLTTGCTTPLVNPKEPIQASQTTTPNADVNLSGRWVNQRGSILHIEERDNILRGQFTTAVAITKTCIGYPASFTGYRNDNAIALSLTLEGCKSPAVVAMTGSVHYNAEGNEEINMLALTQFKGKELWNSRIVSTDFYTRVGNN